MRANNKAKIAVNILLITIVCFVFLFLWELSFKWLQYNRFSFAMKPSAKRSPIEYIGEKIKYEVRMGNLRMGDAVYNYAEPEKLNGGLADIVTFETKIAGRFYDFEKIYSDPKTFLPLRVERKIDSWPVKENIVEEYDQQNFFAKITKFKNNASQQQVIRKAGPINNAILLPFYVRRIPDLKLGWILRAELPTQTFQIKLISLQELQLPGGKVQVYYFASVPKKFEIWITADDRRIPVKIKGAGYLGYTLVMKEYQAP